MILVTGGTGFVGKRLVRKLVEIGNKHIRCLVRPGTPRDIFHSILPDLSVSDVEIFPASFNDNPALKHALKGVNIVYHAAVSKTGSTASMVANTVAGSDNLYKACLEAQISRFVLVSSFSVIGVAKLFRGTVIDESIPMEEHPDLRDPYSFSKHRQEVLAWEYAKESGLPLVVVRPGVVFGPGNNILGPRIGVKLSRLFLHLGGSNTIPLTYVDNCAEAIVLAGTVPKVEREIFCIVDDDLPESQYLLKRYCKEVDSLYIIRIPYRLLRILSKCNVWYTNWTKGHIPAVFTPYQVDSMWKSHRFSNKKAKKMLGWKPKVSMRDALDITYSFLSQEERVQKGNYAI